MVDQLTSIKGKDCPDAPVMPKAFNAVHAPLHGEMQDVCRAMTIMIPFCQRVSEPGECLADKDGHVLHAVPCRKPPRCSAAAAPAAAKLPASWQSAAESVLDQQPGCSTVLPASSGYDGKDSKVSPGTFSNCQPSKTLTFDTSCSSPLVKFQAPAWSCQFTCLWQASALLLMNFASNHGIT